MNKGKAGSGVDFGMPTLIETETLEDCAQLCRELGLRFIELNMNLPQYQLDQICAKTLLESAKRYGIYYTIHLDEGLNVTDLNRRVAEAYRETVYETIELAVGLGCPILNMHLSPGVHFTLPDRKVCLFEQYRQRYLEDMGSFRDECQRRIGGRDVTICVENSGGYQSFQLAGLDLLLESPVFGLTYDIGHDHCAGGVDGPEILVRGARLRHMHVHDAMGAKDHLPLGSGELPLGDHLALAQAQGCRVVLETKTIQGLRQSVAWVRSHV